jgi:hypothetical protein
MAAVASIIPIISGIGQVFTAFSSGGAASNAGDSQAAANNYNAAVARNNAIAAEQAAAANASQQERINMARQGKLQAGLLKSGVLMEGTPLMLVEDEAAQGELEKQKILHQGKTQAANYRSQATMDDYQGQVARSAGSSKSSGIINSGIFSGISTIGSSLLKN